MQLVAAHAQQQTCMFLQACLERHTLDGPVYIKLHKETDRTGEVDWFTTVNVNLTSIEKSTLQTKSCECTKVTNGDPEWRDLRWLMPKSGKCGKATD